MGEQKELVKQKLIDLVFFSDKEYSKPEIYDILEKELSIPRPSLRRTIIDIRSDYKKLLEALD